MRGTTKFSKAGLLMVFMSLSSLAAVAQPKENTLSNPLAQALLVIMILLLLAIIILANVVNSAASMFREKMRQEREASSAGGKLLTTAGLLLLAGGALLMPQTGMAQATEAVADVAKAAPVTYNGLSAGTFYLMLGVIAVEIIILMALTWQLRFLVGIESRRTSTAAAEDVKPKESWWWRFNKAASAEEEEAIDLSHDYDGISELDNKMPPWWIAAFALTILFGGVYLWRYHVAHSAPLQLEELELAMQKAEADQQKYLASAANKVDENSVKMLDAGGIAAGKSLFDGNCVACHGANGEGASVGPNLTDDYWLHGGTINEVFKTIKYGVVEKGMRSWKDDFSPVQMAQLASYIKSLKGSKPANAKEPQGTLYEEGAAAADSAAPAATAPPAQ